jgi:putative intracellular protease/amidase
MTKQQRKKILIAITSHDELVNTTRKTGYWLGEVTHFHHVLHAAGWAQDFVSPHGGAPPLDQHSVTGLFSFDSVNKQFLADAKLAAQLQHTLTPDQLDPDNYSAIYYAGGHGAMFDLPNHAKLNASAASIYERGGFVTAVCHGSAGLLNITLTGGKRLIEGRRVTGYANIEERLIQLTKHVPYLLEDELKQRGGDYRRGFPFTPHVEVDERVISGQNPQSAKAVAQALLACLTALETQTQHEMISRTG